MNSCAWTDRDAEIRTAAGAPSGAPHSPQNFATEAFSAPHWGQVRGSAVPHSLQNFLPTEFSNPQLEQCITNLFRAYLPATCIRRGRRAQLDQSPIAARLLRVSVSNSDLESAHRSSSQSRTRQLTRARLNNCQATVLLASFRQIAGYGRLGNLEPEHEQLTVNSRCTPKEVLPSHSFDQFADFARNPGTSASPATT